MCVIAAVLLGLFVPAARSQPAPAAASRVALVVGVSAYKHVPTLANPANDARGVAAALTRLGFDVDAVIDPDRPALESAVRRLGQRARTATAAIVFYAGHALEVGGRNWLLPTGANPSTERDLRFEALDLDGLLEQLDGGARISIVLLDSCRDNPFRLRFAAGARGAGPSGGLAPARAAVGTLIAFATAPGTFALDGAGENSPFTTALLRHIEKPGLEVRQLMAEVRREVREATRGQQIPWEHSALEGDFFFKAAPPAPGATRGRAGGPDAEILFWQSIRDSANPAELQSYLSRYPDGVFADLARSRLARPGGAAASAGSNLPAATTTEALALRRLIGALPPQSARRRTAAETALALYVAERFNRAFALALPDHGMQQTAGWQQPGDARDAVLERCQVRHGQPCALFAENDEPRAPPSGRPWSPVDMPRARYAGLYDPAQVPGLRPEQRAAPEAAAYGQAPAPKAMAWHDWGRVFTATGAASKQEAEAEALRRCNGDQDRQGRGGPCYLYAAGDRVILPQRRTSPLTQAGPGR